MKLAEMADLLDGLAAFLDKHLQKTPLNDLRELSNCLRQFGEESVQTFSRFVTEAKTGQKAARTTASRSKKSGPEQIAALAERIQQCKANIRTVSYSEIHSITQELEKLTVPQIREVADRVNGPVTRKRKGEIVSELKAWLENLKQSADQSSFTLSASAPGGSDSR
jgi:hypothetical protein